MQGVLIEPEFYAILKEDGLPTARKPDGSYWDAKSQEAWEEWMRSNDETHRKDDKSLPSPVLASR